MESDFTGLAAKIRNRFVEQDNPAVKDIKNPLPFGSLTKKEFSIAISQQWVEKKGKAWHLTSKFSDLVSDLPVPHLEEEDTNPQHRQDINPQHRPSKPNTPVMEFDTPVSRTNLPDEPQGPNQVKIMEIIYRGTNNLGHPNLLIVGEDAEKNMRRIVRGIPLDLGKKLCQHPQKFSGRILAVDEKNNFVGIVMGQVRLGSPSKGEVTHSPASLTPQAVQAGYESESYNPEELLTREELEGLKQNQPNSPEIDR